MTAAPEPTRGVRVKRTLARRLFFRRQFYLQILRIALDRARTGPRQQRAFVSLMGGIGDLVNCFPSLEQLSERYTVDVGTAGYPYLALVRANPHVRRVWTPFIYKPHRAAHRRLIERVLTRFYERVWLLDFSDADWWKEGRHFSRIYSDRLECPPPERGVIYVPESHRREADAFLARRGLDRFVYAVQQVRRRLPWKSWPVPHWHALFRLIHEHTALPILVDTTGSDERALPDFCLDVGRLDILTAAAVIARARAFVGSDSGLTHVAAAVGVPTVSVHVGFPPATCQPLGEHVTLVTQRRPFDDPVATTPEEAYAAVKRVLTP